MTLPPSRRNLSGMCGRLIALIAVALACLLGAEAASACSCAGPAPGESATHYVRERAKTSDGVVAAKLLRVERPPSSSPVPSFEPVVFTFRIQRIYRGRDLLGPGNRLEVVAPANDGANCGLPDQRGEKLGMFLYREGGEWTSNSCSLAAPQLLREALSGKRNKQLTGASGLGCAGDSGDAQA